MVTAAAIKAWIEAGLDGALAIVHGDDGQHFDAEVVCPAFDGISVVKQHQLVYRALGERMGREIHALALRTHTPAQWAETRAQRDA